MSNFHFSRVLVCFVADSLGHLSSPMGFTKRPKAGTLRARILLQSSTPDPAKAKAESTQRAPRSKTFHPKQALSVHLMGGETLSAGLSGTRPMRASRQVSILRFRFFFCCPSLSLGLSITDCSRQKTRRESSTHMEPHFLKIRLCDHQPLNCNECNCLHPRLFLPSHKNHGRRRWKKADRDS